MLPQITAAFLLLVLVYLFAYLWRKLGGSRYYFPLNPFTFLFCSILIGGLSLAFMALLGFQYALLAFAEASGIVMSFSHPVFGVSFFVANLIMRPWEILPDNALMKVLPKLLAGIALLSYLLFGVKRGSYSIIWNSALSLFVSLLLWLLVAALFSGDVGVGLDFHFTSFFPILVLVLLILNVFFEAIDFEALRGSVCISVAGVIAGAIYTTMYFPTEKAGGRLEGVGLLGNANDLGALIALVLPLVVFPLFVRGRSTGKWMAGAALCSLFGLGLVWSASRGAMLSLVVAGVVYFFVRFRLSAKSLAAVVCVGVAAMALFSLIERSETDLEGSSTSRWNYAVAGFRMLKSNPLIGVGLNNYSVLYEAYTPSFTEWGTRTAHSSWVLIMAEAGLPGLVLFASLYLVTLRCAWRIRHEAPEFLLSMVSYGVAMSFLSHTYTFIPYLLFALVLTASRIYKPKPAQVAKAAACLLALLVCGAPDSHASGLRIEASSSGQKPIGGIQPETSGRLVLKGSRGEILNFLLKVSGEGCGRFSHDIGPELVTVRLYSMPPVETEHPSFPGAHVGLHFDPLLPVSSGEVCAGGDAWYWGELEISRGAAPGLVRSRIAVGDASLPVEVTVWKMEIPERPVLPAYSEMTSWFNVLGHFGKREEGEEILAARYVTAMQAHRIYPLKSGIAWPRIHDRDGEPVLDLDGSPDPDRSFRAVVLSGRPEWAYFDFPTTAYYPHLGRPEVVRYFRAVENSIPGISRPGRAITYLWDEPKREEMPRLEDLARLVKAEAPSLKVMVTIGPEKGLEDLVDIFVPVMNYLGAPGHLPFEAYKRAQGEGKELWWYVSCLSHGCLASVDARTPDFVIDRPASYIRSAAWLSMKYGMDAFLYYSVNNGYQFHPGRDPWKSLWDFSGNGDGTLFYPGRPGERGLEDHQPIASIRLKLWREASYDAEYVRWMNEARPRAAWWQSEMDKLVPSVRDWDRDYMRYESLRDRAGEYLDSLSAVSKGAST